MVGMSLSTGVISRTGWVREQMERNDMRHNPSQLSVGARAGKNSGADPWALAGGNVEW